MTNRLVEAVLVSALFLGSVRLLSNDVKPLIGGDVSALGLLGVVGALVLARRTFKKIKQAHCLVKKSFYIYEAKL